MSRATETRRGEEGDKGQRDRCAHFLPFEAFSDQDDRREDEHVGEIDQQAAAESNRFRDDGHCEALTSWLLFVAGGFYQARKLTLVARERRDCLAVVPKLMGHGPRVEQSEQPLASHVVEIGDVELGARCHPSPSPDPDDG